MDGPVMHLDHPSIHLIFGRRGSGKSFLACKIARDWPHGGRVYAVDPVATVPPRDQHVAFHAHVWSPEMPSSLPHGVRLLIVDEADIYLPASGKPHPLLMQLVRRGRHAGVTLVLISQRPQAIRYDAFALSDSVCVFAVSGSHDLDRIEQLDDGFPPLRETIRTLPQGAHFRYTQRTGVIEHCPRANK